MGVYLSMHCRLLLPVRVLRGGRTDRDERAVPELHVPQPDAHVLPQRLPLHQAGRQELHRREEGRPVLPHHHVPSK